MGAVHFVCKDESEAKRVESNAKIVARAMYSNPPVHGGKIVEKVLSDSNLKQQWLSDVKVMSDRIFAMRDALKGELVSLGSPHSWQHIVDQIGMFCFTGISAEQVDRMKNDYSIYLTRNGRISMAGVTTKNVKKVAEALHMVTKDEKPDN